MTRSKDWNSAQQLLTDAIDEDFFRNFVDFSNRTDLLRTYNFSAEFQSILLSADLVTWDDLYNVIGRAMRRYYRGSNQTDNLGKLKFTLNEKGFSKEFIDAFDRMANRQIGRTTDLMKIHFSEDMSIRNLTYLEDNLNKYFYEMLDTSEELRREYQHLEGYEIVRIRAFTHPGSTEIFIEPRVAILLIGSLISLGTALAVTSMWAINTMRRGRGRFVLGKHVPLSDETTVSEDQPDGQEGLGENLTEVDPLVEVPELQIASGGGRQIFQERIEEMIKNERAFSIIKVGEYITGFENSW